MGIFDSIKKSEKLSDEQKKWNKMWDLWVEECIESPYAELMTYQSEVNNGGHDQYFSNLEERGVLQKEIVSVEKILPEILKDNFKEAYNAYLVLYKDEDNEEAQVKLDDCDDIFYQNESEINKILEEYASRIEL